MRMSNGVKAGTAAVWLVLAGATAAGCSNTVDGAATCPGCGAGGEPNFPIGRPTVSPPTVSPPTVSPPTVSPPSAPAPVPPGRGDTLPPSSGGFVFIETKSGQTRCQISEQTVGCESNFTNAPIVGGEPANGVEVTADGHLRWITGNLGAIPTTTIDYARYHAVGWTIEATSKGTRFTNDRTGHGMFVSTEEVDVF
ncbi:hypothetical protein [Candidatus Mycolicibacterium alkanivorans]|uniref:Lipoprotein LpqJ n=1 Tax=Candidatus Mycolicibacterium alkanivorans TaxID=2954114 RepID=A0ABS9YRE7_9MYCO|nr:hypothetical protein [Candidatus Mycolicibacterium alkanivorans]MCI4673748.1 hypothetical protein [Candidatus Mycolicibacterium alkanivorans]